MLNLFVLNVFGQVVWCNTCWSPLLPSPPEFILVHALMFPMQPQVINEGLDCALAEDETQATSCKASSWTWGSMLE